MDHFQRRHRPRRSAPRRREIGFTLLELLIALVVLAVAGFTVSARVGEIVQQTFALERKAVAEWVAQNAAHRARLEHSDGSEAISTGTDRERVVMGRRDWQVETQVRSTQHPWLRRVEVRVYELVDGDRTGPFDELVTFVGRH